MSNGKERVLKREAVKQIKEEESPKKTPQPSFLLLFERCGGGSSDEYERMRETKQG